MKFGIVGFGRFGKLWAKALLSFGRVLIYNPSEVHPSSGSSIEVTSLQEVAQADIVFILVPISAFEKSCIELKAFLSPTTLVVDCCSVKIYPVEVMRRVFSPTQPLLATHPLFGPDSVKRSGGLADHKMVICPLQPSQDKANQLLAIFNEMGLRILIATPEEHDRQMAHSQGLLHFLGRGLEVLDLQPQELETPDFKALLSIQSMVANDTWQLFLDMQQYNPYVKEIRQKFIDQLITLDKQIAGDKL
jgi:prephenate dehydrogenase